jgi:hypothetical protein
MHSDKWQMEYNHNQIFSQYFRSLASIAMLLHTLLMLAAAAAAD